MPPTIDLRRGDVYLYTAPGGGTTANLLIHNGAGWRVMGNRAFVANDAERALLTITYAGMRAENLSDGVIWRHNGTAWVPTNEGTLIQSKMWRTNGTAAATLNTDNVIPMNASRVAAGFTFSDADDALILPHDGTYDMQGNYYITGGVTGQCNNWFRRTRAGAIASVAAGPIAYKSSTTLDTTMLWEVKGVPLKAGDKIALVIYPYVTGMSYYGLNEMAGSFVTLTYTGPLNGATPV